jgi:hypothetical protein
MYGEPAPNRADIYVQRRVLWRMPSGSTTLKLQSIAYCCGVARWETEAATSGAEAPAPPPVGVRA